MATSLGRTPSPTSQQHYTGLIETGPETAISIPKEQLDPLLNNLVEISPNYIVRVHDVAVTFLQHLRFSDIPIRNIHFAGSKLTDIFATKLDCNDIDMKLISFGDKKTASGIFFQVEKILTLAIAHLTLTPPGFSPPKINLSSFKPVFMPNFSLKGYSLPNAPGHLPFEISVLITNMPDHHISNSVMNIDSLKIPISIFNDFYLGTGEANQFLLYSSQGECSSVLFDIQQKIMTAENPESIQKFGWCRYLLGIIDGFTAPNPRLNQAFFENEIQAKDNFIYDINQFVQRKKAKNRDLYWTFFLCNAIFNCPQKDSSYERLIQSFISSVKFSKENSPWIHLLKSLLSDSFPLQHLPFLLKLFIPLFSKEISLKNHMAETWLQCEMIHSDHSLFLLIPFYNSADEESRRVCLPLLKDLAISPPFICTTQSLPWIDPPSIFRDLLCLEGRLPQETALAWNLRFPSLNLLKDWNTSPHLTKKSFPLLKAHLLLTKIKKEKFHALPFKIALNGCDLSLLNTQEKMELISNFIEKRKNILSCLSSPYAKCFALPYSPLDLLLHLIPLCADNEKPKIACSSIKEILQIYESQLIQDVPFFWEKLKNVTSLIMPFTTNYKPWNQLLSSLSSHLFQSHLKDRSQTFPTPSLGEFFETLLSLTDFSTQDNRSCRERLFLFTLLIDVNPVKARDQLLTILEDPATENKITNLKNHFINYPFEDPFSFKPTFDFLLENKQTQKARHLLQYQQALTLDPENNLEFFHLLCQSLKIEENIASSLKIIEENINKASQKDKTAWAFYINLHEIPQIANYLEDSFLLTESCKSYLLSDTTEKTEILYATYREILILRMQSSNANPRNHQLALCLTWLRTDKTQVLSTLTHIFRKSLTDPEKAFQVAFFIGTHFKDSLDSSFLEALSTPSSIFYAHTLLYTLSKENSEFFSLETRKHYLSLFIDKIEDLIPKEGKTLEQQLNYYLSFATDSERFALAQKGCLIPSLKVFSLASSFIIDLETVFNQSAWTPSLLHSWIDFLNQTSLLSDTYTQLFLGKLTNHASLENQMLIIKMIPSFTKYSRDLFLIQSKMEGNRIIEERNSLDSLSYLPFLMNKDIAPLLLQDPDMHLVFLTIAQIALEHPCSNETFSRIIEILSSYFKTEASPQEHHKQLLMTCFDLLSSKSIKVKNLSPETSVLILENLCPVIDINLLSTKNWKVLSDCAAATASIPTKTKFFIKAEVALKELMKDIDILDPHFLYKKNIIAECSRHVVSFFLRKNRPDSIKEAWNLVRQIHETRLNFSIKERYSELFNFMELTSQEEITKYLMASNCPIRFAPVDIDISSDLISYCYFIEKTVVEYGIVNSPIEIPAFILYQSIKGLEQKKPEQAKILTDILINTISRIVLNKKPGKHPLSLAMIALELLKGGPNSLPIDKAFKTHQFISQLLILAFNSVETTKETVHFFFMYTHFIRMELGKLPASSLKFNLYQKESLFSGSISDFTYRVLQKTLDVAVPPPTSDPDNIINTLAHLAGFSFLNCPDYFENSKCKIPKSFVINILKRLFSIKEQEVADYEIFEVIYSFIKVSLLQKNFLIDLTREMAISRGVSIPNIYTKILTDNRAKQEMSWEMILTLTYKLETLSWSDAELSLFMPIYTTFLDSQYVLHETSNTPKTLPLRPLLDTYLQLVEQSPEVSIPINLILDLVKRPLYYTSSIDTTAFLFVILRKIANRISTVSYSEESLRNHKDDLLIEIYHDFHAALPIAEKVLFEPILDQVAIKERHRT